MLFKISVNCCLKKKKKKKELKKKTSNRATCINMHEHAFTCKCVYSISLFQYTFS